MSETQAPPRERGIVCSAAEVTGLLQGTVTELRRVVVVKPWKRDTWTERGTSIPCWSQKWATVWDNGTWHTWDANGVGGENACEDDVESAKAWALKCALRQGFIPCPFGQPGDRLWCRETWAKPAPGILTRDDPGTLIYAADYPRFAQTGFGPWRPSTQMPRHSSRLTLEIQRVAVERAGDRWDWGIAVKRL